MVNKPNRPADEELKRERLEVTERISRANTNLIERVVEQGVRFQLEEDETLRITIGVPPLQFYTQRVGQVRINVDRKSDEIVGFVIERISEYLDDHPVTAGGFHALLPGLRRVGVIQLPPRTPSNESLREDFRELVPA
ncbi:MAG: hypothetical protein WEC75_02820 [Dehalococcoidia bacterium]